MDRRKLTLALGLLLAAAAPAFGDGIVRDGVGATAAGRGGTNIAHSDNGAILHDNPAGMVNLRSRGLVEIGADTLITELDYSDPDPNDTNGLFRPFVLPELSVIRRSESGDWAAGVGVFLPAGFGAQYDMFNPILGPHDYKSLGALARIVPGASYALSDRLSVGATFGLAISHVELEGPFFLQTGPLAGLPTLFDLQATGAAPTWSVGMQYELDDRTTLGLTYIDEMRFRQDGNVDVQAFGIAPLPLQSEFDAEVDLVWPRSLGFGLTREIGQRHRVSFDLLWFDWSHAFDRIDIRLTDASNPIIPLLVGPEIRDSFPLDWHDGISARLGYEFLLSPCEVIRAGYVYNSRTIPDSTLTPYIGGILEHSFTIGYGRRWNSFRFDAGYQFAFGPERHVGVSDLVGGDFSFSEFKAQAHWITLGVTYFF